MPFPKIFTSRRSKANAIDSSNAAPLGAFAIFLSLPVLAAGLGYFVDIFDLLLFSIVRVPSLHDLGLNAAEVADRGLEILNVQMIGLLLGGVFWGVLGDRKGRLSVLFGSIVIYSVANIANGFVHTVPEYLCWRFIAGLGLAGELGAGVTLVSELLPKDRRGLGTAFISALGVLGAVAAFFIANEFSWRACYFTGGVLGLLLLLMRVRIFESGMFTKMLHSNASRGNFFKFFTNWNRFRRYILCIFIGLPCWYLVGILITFSPEFGKALGIQGAVNAGQATMITYTAISIGGIAIGFFSQWLRSRKIALAVFFALFVIGIALYFLQSHHSTPWMMYAICALLGFSTGYWAMFVTMGAELFGTNLRATAATTIPNMVRGALPLISLLFTALKPSLGMTKSGLMTGVVVMLIAFVSLIFLEETFDKDLNYIEEN